MLPALGQPLNSISRWLRRSNTPSTITTEITEDVKEKIDEDRCVSGTDSAFGVDEIMRIDFIAELPFEIAVSIMANIKDIHTLATAARVSRRWNIISEDNEIWKSLFLRSKFKPLSSTMLGQTFPPPSSAQMGPRTASSDLMEDSNKAGARGNGAGAGLGISGATSSSSTSTSTLVSRSNTTQKQPPRRRNWKWIFKQRLTLERNWVKGNYSVRSIQGHGDSVYCIQFDPYRIVSGSRDKTIKFWDVQSALASPASAVSVAGVVSPAPPPPAGSSSPVGPYRSISGHAGSVLCLQYDHRYIVTGSSDSTIIVWDFKTGRKLHVLEGHSYHVLDVRLNEDRIVSCSKDTTVKIWNLLTGKLIYNLEGHHAAVNAVHLNGDLVASASGDCLIKLWNIRTGAHVRDFVGHTRGLACVQYDGKILVSGSNDHTIKIWNAATGVCVRTLNGHTDLVRTLCFDSERIVSGSYDTTIKIWDMKSGELLHTLEGHHSSWIFHVQMDATKIISAGQDRKIAIWDFSQGVEITEELA
ncbi:hypothetical protein HDU76_010286 [Blyttiomyces sp. JEL0837]|nr:hypothetical protein HDU76_010286 [Blyttiomyces sp. JEL0837]